ncbi:putative 2-dehydropantoate 2-reductase [Marinobacterium zhoushanense]|uniref:2-dehydropantoate 2-reductase n=1 Tax=Marinobacterium zhoushanense TaxID=1679163 RepID=A0ABQ1K3Q3_9GAMM|nr:2-dehydropantoate 2-reductase [Marinobacterium zhoushanense]GGB83416.1 putative 2-dehydropantoate 2-reductase [Marinobacterium zhoushanense]
MRWHILGAGAIGCLYAERLTRAGIAVTLLLRDDVQLDRLKQLGGQLRIQRHNAWHTAQVDAEMIAASGTIQHLLVTTKAYDSLDAIHAISPRLTPDAQILLLQNGYGHQQKSAAALSPRPVWAGITTSGARRAAPFEVIQSGEGQTLIGRLNPPAAASASYPAGWERLDHPVQISTDITRALWQKLAINAAINPLTALHGCRNGELLKADYREELTALCSEIERVATACSQPLFDTPLLEQVQRVANTTAQNRSSMLEDLRAGRRTEIEQITGFLCSAAREVGVDTPLNTRLLNAVRFEQSLNTREGPA